MSRFRLEGLLVGSVRTLRDRVATYKWRRTLKPQYPQRVGEHMEWWGPRTMNDTRSSTMVHHRVAELYASLKGHREWLRGSERGKFPDSPMSEKIDEIDYIVDAMDPCYPKTVIYAAVQVELIHRPLLSFRKTFERLMSEGRRQAREGFASQGFAYCFMRAYDAL